MTPGSGITESIAMTNAIILDIDGQDSIIVAEPPFEVSRADEDLFC